MILLQSNSQHFTSCNKNQQYSYVMKRVSLAQTPKVKPTNKNKVKIHSKTKDKKFNPLEYLNSLIDQMHDHRFDTVKKRTPSQAKRDMKSALDYKTPPTDRTASCSKVRSKSSYSQYRKKSVAMKDLLRVDIGNAITEEDNIIRFTQETQNYISQSPIRSLSPYPANLSRLAAVRRIQRAWRNYQTLKVVRKYYQYYKNLMKREMQLNEAKIQHSSSRKKEPMSDGRRQFERTLKIRKDGNSSGLNNKTVRLNLNDLVQSLQFSSQLASQNTTKEMYQDNQTVSLNQMQTVQLQIQSKEQEELSSTSQVCTSKDLKFVIDMFRNSHQLASRQINEQLSKIQYNLSPMASVNDQYSQNSQQSQHESGDNSDINEGVSSVFQQMERVIKKKYVLLAEQVEHRRKDKIIQNDVARLKQEQLQGRMQRQLRSIRKCKEQYQKGTISLKQNMLKLQIDSSFIDKLKQQHIPSSHRVRKCYSAQTVVLKSIIQQIHINNLDIELPQSYSPPLLQPAQQQKQQQRNLMFPTSPPSSNIRSPSSAQVNQSNHSLNCYQFTDSSNKLRQQIYNYSIFSQPFSQQKLCCEQMNQFNDSLVDIQHSQQSQMISVRQQQSASKSQQQNDSLKVIKECTQQMQQEIEIFLLNEVVSQIYLTVKLYNGVKSFIEHAYQFKIISDYDIYHFLNKQLPMYYQPMDQMLKKFNQKINPDSLQILKLIRDYQFQIQEYELVLPQEVFKNYRRKVEEQYAKNIRSEQDQKINIQNIEGFKKEVAHCVREREGDKKIKKVKFMNFERDLKIMYMKSVFNCFNQYIIETKSFYTFMNSRSSIGPGQLTLALKEYNWKCELPQCLKVIDQAKGRVMALIHEKCMLPIFKNYRELQCFQKQITKQISCELQQNEFKWVNYMDEVLQMWQDLSLSITDTLLEQATTELIQLL